MRVLPDGGSDARQAFERGTAPARPAAPNGQSDGPEGPPPGRATAVRVAIVIGAVLVVALVVAIIVVAVQRQPAEQRITSDADTGAAEAQVVRDRPDQTGDPLAAGPQTADAQGGDDLAVQRAADLGAGLQGPAMFATQFAHTYLNFSDADPAKRAATLAPFLAPGLDPQLGWSGQGAQAAGVLMPLDAVRDGERITVTVAALVSGTPYARWVHLAVPLAEDADGGLAVIASPSYVPAPAAGDVTALAEPAADIALSAELRPVVTQVMEAYGAQAIVTVPGATVDGADIPGLAGQYRMAAVTSLVVARGEDAEREAVVTVSWDADAVGGPLLQSYLLQLVDEGDGWRVAGIGPR